MTAESVKRSDFGLFVVGGTDDGADKHHDHEKAQVIKRLNAIGREGAVDHEAAAQNGGSRQNEPLEGLFFPRVDHEGDEHGDVSGIQGDDRQFIRLPVEEGGAHAVDEEEVPVQIPQRADDDTEPGGVGGHAGLLIHLGEEAGGDALVADAQGISPAGGAHHQAVGGAQAADNDEHKHNGAGSGTDGQILVVDDMLGMTKGFSPKFLRRYADLNTVMTDAIGNYIRDVKSSDFPNSEESY